MANTSSRVYYGNMAASEVPFVWESRPGTPKNPISSSALPPLTPPPSYLSTPKHNHKKKKKHRLSNYPLLAIIFPKLAVKKSDFFSPSPSSASSPSSPSSSSSITWPCPQSPRQRRRLFSSRGEEGGQQIVGSTSILCFGLGYGVSSGVRRCYYKATGKKAAFLSNIVRHGSSHGVH